MNRLGIMVDVSHISKAASLEAMQLSASPVIASHSGAHAVNAHPRNMDDEQLVALRENGGVMQAVALGAFVKSPSAEQQAEVGALRESIGFTSFSQMTDEQRVAFREGMAEIRSRYPAVNVADFVDHIDHAVTLIGLDYVRDQFRLRRGRRDRGLERRLGDLQRDAGTGPAGLFRGRDPPVVGRQYAQDLARGRGRGGRTPAGRGLIRRMRPPRPRHRPRAAASFRALGAVLSLAAAGSACRMADDVASSADGPYRIGATLEVGAAPHGIRFSPDGDTAWVALSGEGRIAVVDLAVLSAADPASPAVVARWEAGTDAARPDPRR